MKNIPLLLVLMAFSTASYPSEGDLYCVSPVDRCTEDIGLIRPDSSEGSFECKYSMKIGDSEIVELNSDKSTAIKTLVESPMVEIYKTEKRVKSFRVPKDSTKCIIFKGIYETWMLAEEYQAAVFCKCP